MADVPRDPRSGGPRPDEPRWPASIAVVIALVLYVTLPNKFTFGPVWVAPLLVLALLVPLSIIAPSRHRETRGQRMASIALIGIMNLFNIASVVLLVYEALFGHIPRDLPAKEFATRLLIDGAQIWATNIIVYGLWYWEIDGGGPERRAHTPTAFDLKGADFLFPQMAAGARHAAACIDQDWKPYFVDYLYVAFTNSLAFSPADVMPLTRRAKALMTTEALTSFVTIAVVLARAVGIIG